VPQASGSDRAPAHPLRPSHPLGPAERHRPPYSPLIFRRTTGTDGRLGTRTWFRIQTSIPLRGRAGYLRPSLPLGAWPGVLGFWALPTFAQRWEPRRGDAFRTVDHESRQIAPFPRRPSHLTCVLAHLLPPPATCHLPDSETLPLSTLTRPKAAELGLYTSSRGQALVCSTLG
jgi:hypothetical protein